MEQVIDQEEKAAQEVEVEFEVEAEAITSVGDLSPRQDVGH